MVAVEKAIVRRKARSWRYGWAVAAVSAGLVVAPVSVPGVAWADGTESGASAGDGNSGESTAAPDRGTAKAPKLRDRRSEASSSSGPVAGTDTASGTDEPLVPKKRRSSDPEAGALPEVIGESGALARPQASRARPVLQSVAAPSQRSAPEAPSSDAPAAAQSAATQPELSGKSTAPRPVAALTPSAVEVTTPAPPQPLSPIATILELPGRIINAVLQFLDFTAAAHGPQSPFNIAPINDMLFAAFREIERWAGLHQTPAVQPVLPTMVYTGPTDRLTPTVAQFLNASTAAYGLGTTPGGLVPFTVNGFQLQSTNIFSGMSGKAWVTPQGQVVIAYQGTTGGTNLLFNSLITIAQVVADLQVVLTGTTPWAFYDALDFAHRVQDEAAAQGYAADDVFVTGHSLGGWEAQFVAQQTGLSGIGFEAPGMNTAVDGNGATSNFVNIAQYGSPVAFMASDLPGLQPFLPPYVPGGGLKPHYGPIVVIGDRAAMNPIVNSAAMWGTGVIGSLIFAIDFFANFIQYHLMGVQAYHLDVDPDPGVVPWLGTRQGTVHTGYGELTIQQLLAAASDDGILLKP